MSNPELCQSPHLGVVINEPNANEPMLLEYNISPPQNTTRYTICSLGYSATLFSGLTTAAAAASGAAGAGILNGAGYTNYSIKPAATAGAFGGAIIAIPMVILLLCYRTIFDESFEERKYMIGQFVLSAAISALSGIVGYGFIDAHNHAVDMDAGQFAASTALGTAIFCTGIASITLSRSDE